VSGNFFNMFEHYYALEPKADRLITEMRNTRDRQPAWYRYVAGFAGGKPVIVVEDPYGGVVPELIEQLGQGRGHDRFRTSVYEAYALGTSMSLPYGSWMGSEIEDAFYAPYELCAEIGGFLAEHERLFSSESAAEVGIVFSVESSLAQEEAARAALANNRLNLISGELAPFWAASEALCDALQPYDVIMFPDGTLRADTVTAEALGCYSVLVLPDCAILTAHQADALLGYLEGGGRAIVTGRLGETLEADRRARLEGHSGLIRVAGSDALIGALPDGPQVVAPPGLDAAIGLHRVAGGVAVHILRYASDPDADRVPELRDLELSVRLAGMDIAGVEAVPEGVGADLRSTGSLHTLRLRDVPLYSIILLRGAGL
jgi:hypothetical protein